MGPTATTLIAPSQEHATDQVAALALSVEALATQLADGDRSLGVLDVEQLRDRAGLLERLAGATAASVARTLHALSSAGGVDADGAASPAAWLRAHSGRSGRDAARVARIASTLDELPHTAAALAAGRITTEAADAIVRAARDTTLGPPDDVDLRLAPVAEAGSPEQLRSEIRRATQQVEGRSMLDDERRQRARRRLSLRRREDGMWALHGLLPAEVGDAARTLLDIFDTADPRDTPADQRRRPDQRLADAFDTAVHALLDHGDLATTGGVSRPHITVVVPVDTFDADLSDPADPQRPVPPDDPVWRRFCPGDTSWGSQYSPQAIRRMCCDAGISRIVTDGASQILNVGRETRQWSAAQRRAIHVRDRTCRGPHCHRPIAWTQIHHLRWWRHHGRTDLDNGLALCTHCHRLIHERGWHAQLDVATAAVTWISPDRQRTFVTYPRPPD